MIAKPLTPSADMDTDAVAKAVKSAKNTLQKVADILSLNNLDMNITISGLCDLAKVTEEEYYSALQISQTGVVVILKRQVKDIFTNNYNPELLRVWNGNMDIQITLDQFAIITYIMDYINKSESGLSDVLREGWKACEDKPVREKLHHLKHLILTHREMGEAEAFYRLIPNLQLKSSNCEVIYLASGFPWNRSK